MIALSQDGRLVDVPELDAAPSASGYRTTGRRLVQPLTCFRASQTSRQRAPATDDGYSLAFRSYGCHPSPREMQARTQELAGDEKTDA
jgi:hypothetical protein